MLWNLIRAELQSSANLFRRGARHDELAGTLTTLVCAAFGAAIIGSNIVASKPVVALIREDPSGALLTLGLGVCLLPFVVLTFSLGMNEARKNLFEPGLPELVLVSPVSRFSILAWAFFRILLASFLFGIAIVGPMAALLLQRTGVDIGGIFILPIAVIVVVSPILAVIILVQVILMRWFASPRMKFALNAVMALSTLGFALLIGFGFLGGNPGAEKVANFIEDAPRFPALLHAPAHLIAWCAGGSFHLETLLTSLLLLLLPIPLLALASPIYNRAFENSQVSGPPLFRTKRFGMKRKWPTTVTASMLRKDFTLFMQQPGNSLALIFLAVLIFMIRGAFLKEANPDDAIPVVTAQVFHLGILWLMSTLIFGSAITPGFVMTDRDQLSLLITSPASRRALLRGKLGGLILPLTWILLICLAAAIYSNFTARGIFGFLLLALPFTWLTVGVTVMAGTIPFCARPQEGPAGTGMLATVLPILIVMAVEIGLIVAMHWCQTHVRRYYQGRGPFEGMNETAVYLTVLAGIWGVGLVGGWVSYRIGVRNYRRLLSAVG